MLDLTSKKMGWKKGMFVVCVLVVLSSAVVWADSGLEVSSLLLKVSLKEDESVTRMFSVTSEVGQDYSLEVFSVPGVKLSETSFVLDKGERKEIGVDFDSRGVDSGVYVGSIHIKNIHETLSLPVVMEVESRDVFFDANLDIPPAYTEIKAGERVVAQVKIFDLTSGGGTQEGLNGLGIVSIDLEYSIFDLDGNVLSSEGERLVVDKQTQITKTFNFPSSVEAGDYVISVLVRYGSSVGISSQMFSIKGEETEPFSMGSFSYSSTLILFLILLFTFGVVFLFVYIVRDRDKIIDDLKKYHRRELNMQKEMLEQQAKFLKQKGNYNIDVKKEVAEKVGELKKEQKKQVSELRSLKNSGNVGEMKKKIREWEKRGYHAGGLKYKLRELSVKDMNKLMKGWKKKGYK
jgi:hypothetical protein